MIHPLRSSIRGLCAPGFVVVSLVVAATSFGDDLEVVVDDVAALRRSAARGIEIVAKAARNYPEHRDCFSCHHQTLPVLAMVTGRDHGLAVDDEVVTAAVDFSRKFFAARAARMEDGEGVGGASMTVGYGLWMLALAGNDRDTLTSAMVAFLLATQQDDGRWKTSSIRPPLEESDIACTVLAVHTMERFATDAQREAVTQAAAKAKRWLLEAKATSQEDRNSLLSGLSLVRASAASIDAAREAVLAAQRVDGGWAQIDGMESDAYSTGQTLFTLRQTRTPTTDPAYRRGLRFLLSTQHDDGSWFVKSRSKPIQTLFDNGDPHGTDQFISISATAWATTALALAIDREERAPFDATKSE